MLSPVSRTVESQLVSKMCRVKSVGVGTVVVDVEPAGAETDTHAGVDAPLQSLRTADFALQLVSWVTQATRLDCYTCIWRPIPLHRLLSLH